MVFSRAYLPPLAVFSSLKSVPVKSHPTSDCSWVDHPLFRLFGLLLPSVCAVLLASDMLHISNFRERVQRGVDIESNVKRFSGSGHFCTSFTSRSLSTD